MISEDMHRIIGEYIEVNGDIVNAEFNSKAPKFYSKWVSRRHRKKLYKSLEKLRKSHYVLQWYNLHEYFMSLYNNYEGEGFGSINSVVWEPGYRMLEAVISFNEYIIIIRFDYVDKEYDQSSKFNLIMKDKRGGESINIYISELFSNQRRAQSMVRDLNEQLLNELCDYIETLIIFPYFEDEIRRKGKTYDQILGK